MDNYINNSSSYQRSIVEEKKSNSSGINKVRNNLSESPVSETDSK